MGVGGRSARFDAYQLTPLTVTVSNTGNQPTGALTVALSGANADSFTLSTTSLASIPTDGSTTFTIRPNNGLLMGTYTAAVTVSNAANGITASFNVSFTVNRFSINLSTIGTHRFPDAFEGYAQSTPHVVTVNNTGNQPTGALTVALSGTNAGSFTLSATSLASIPADGSTTRTFTVRPNNGLLAGTYTATVTVSNVANGITDSFNVSFAVFPQIEIEMVRIQPGTFQMGQAGLETPVHQVTLTQGFYMGRFPVTQEQWYAVMGNNPSWFTTANGSPPVAGETDARRPVESVSWYDVLVFSNRLSMLTGR